MTKHRRSKTLPAPVASTAGESNSPIIQGVTAADLEPDEDEIYRRMVEVWHEARDLERRRATQTIAFEHGPIAIVDIADLHLGSGGVDYERVFHEAEIIRDTPGMWLFLDGDLCDNFVIADLMHVRLAARTTIPEEWALVRKYLRVVASKLVLSVRGNHESWFTLLTGIDYFREVLASVSRSVLYDSDDSRVMVKVGGANIPCRIRHRWRGSSQFNLTHAIERAFLFDQDFLIGFGAHTHASGLTRQFNAAGQTGLAVLAGSYKVMDEYPKRLGLPRANGSTAVTVLIDEDGCLIGVDRLEKAAELMHLFSDK